MDIGLLVLGLIVVLLIWGIRKLSVIKQKRAWLFWSILFVTVFLLVFGANEFLRRKIGGFAGSYPFVESWQIQASEQEVIEAIRELNKSNPNFRIPGKPDYISKRDTGYNWDTYPMQQYLEELKIDSLTPLPEKNFENQYRDYWLFVNLYYPDTKEIVHTWTRPYLDTTITTLAFVSIRKLDGSNKARYINRDFWYVANRLQIAKFKKKISDEIQKQIEKRKGGE